MKRLAVLIGMLSSFSFFSQTIKGTVKDNFGTINPPASTWISVKGLANKGFMIEIEAQAVI